MKHFMRLKPEPFEKIRSGKKTIELRLFDEKRQLVKIGDEIEFTNLGNNNETLTVRVVELHIFKSFEELYNTLPLEKCGHSKNEFGKILASNMEKYYSLEEQMMYDVVGIEFDQE